VGWRTAQEQQARAERAEAALRQIAAWSWDSGSTPAPEVVSRIYCEASAVLRDTAPAGPTAEEAERCRKASGPCTCGAHITGLGDWADTAPAEEHRTYAYRPRGEKP